MPSDLEMYEGILEEQKYLIENYNRNLQMMREDAPANATGAGVVGTGANRLATKDNAPTVKAE